MGEELPPPPFAMSLPVQPMRIPPVVLIVVYLMETALEWELLVGQMAALMEADITR